jgi:hypothetical protein
MIDELQNKIKELEEKLEMEKAVKKSEVMWNKEFQERIEESKNINCVECEQEGRMVKCKKCGAPSFCSEECQSNQAIHQKECVKTLIPSKYNCFNKKCNNTRNILEDPVFYCQICFKAEYCCKKCQEKDLNAHMLICKELAEETLNDNIREFNSNNEALLPPDGNWRIAARKLMQANIEDQKDECPICLHEYEGNMSAQQPLIIFCGHTVCR